MKTALEKERDELKKELASTKQKLESLDTTAKGETEAKNSQTELLKICQSQLEEAEKAQKTLERQLQGSKANVAETQVCLLLLRTAVPDRGRADKYLARLQAEWDADRRQLNELK
eukprot:725723-Rhodomonas_salina.2